MKIIKKEVLVDKKWSGGKTTELYIYPEGSSYLSQQFSFRLSRATIEIESSLFTKLPTVKRELMVLNGALQLIHEKKYNKYLHAYDSDRFKGDWKTNSKGIAEDFNLMMTGCTEGYLEHVSSIENESLTISSDCDWLAVYCVTGESTIETKKINCGDLAILTSTSNQKTLQLSANTNLIIVRIWFND